MRRLPPQKIERNLASLINIVPDLTEELLSAIDQPLKIRSCAKTGKEYLLCDYNRDGDSYRLVCICLTVGCLLLDHRGLISMSLL